MSLKKITPLAHSGLLYAQAGSITVEFGHISVISHAGGYGGSAGRDYKEYIFGNECGIYTAVDSSGGPIYYPDVKYVSSIKSFSIQIGTSTLPETRIEAKSFEGHGDDFHKVGVYDPASLLGASGNIGINHGDEIFGRFTRIAIEKTNLSSKKARYRFTFGPSTK